MDLNPSLQQSLATIFGFSEFRHGQDETITHLLAGHSSLAIFPTGAGKSLCYQFTALHLPHVTLVVSPLLALMKDQLDFLDAKGIPAVKIDSSMSYEDSKYAMEQVRNGQVKILMIAVERLKNEKFRVFLQSIQLSLLVVDEAHCISEWGHNFRPDYLKLPLYCQNFNIPQVLLLTATATQTVQQDMARKFNILPQHVVTTGFYRPNLWLDIKPVDVNDKLPELYNMIKALNGSGIVYVTLQQTAEDVANYLASFGIAAQAYHAGLGSEKRQYIQQQFMKGQMQVIVATIAFGMGIDKSDIRFVIHYELPKSIENYSQEIGRAGRDGAASVCTMLGNIDNLTTLENFIYGDTPDKKSIKHVVEAIKKETNHGKWACSLYSLSAAANIKQSPLKTLLVQLELKGAIKTLYTFYASYQVKLEASLVEILDRFKDERKEFLTCVFDHIQVKKSWGEPDFDSIMAVYSCDRNRIITALQYLEDQKLITMKTAQLTDMYQVNQQALLSTSLVDELYHYFIMNEQAELERIQKMITFFEADACLSLKLSHYFGDMSVEAACGHCSVCAGRVASLSSEMCIEAITTDMILESLVEFIAHIKKKTKSTPSLENCSRFLAGIVPPMYSRHRIKGLKGFALLASKRYDAIHKDVTAVQSKLSF